MVPAPISEFVTIFFSHSSNATDTHLFEKLRRQLSFFQKQGLIQMCYDSAISAGSNMQNIIRSYMNQADIIVLLISADFYDSQQCFDIEMNWALEQQHRRPVHIIPVLLRPIVQDIPLIENATILPTNGKPITSWSNLDAALAEVAQGIYKIVKKLIPQLAHSPKQVPHTQFPLYTLPQRANPFFTNRENILQELYTNFHSKHIGIQAICGLAGIGKTLVALEYARLHQNSYQAVLWLNATTYEGLHTDIITLHRHLGLPIDEQADEQDCMATLKNWLQQHRHWLLILDNLDNFALLDALVPIQHHGHVFITTSSQATGAYASPVSLPQLSVEDGALLLLRRARLISSQGSKHEVSETIHQQALALSYELEGYPLALDQAGAYIEETQRGLDRYLKQYQDQQATLLGKRGRLAQDHPNPVTTTLLLTFQKISALHPEALQLLQFIAFLGPTAIPEEILLLGAHTFRGTLRSLTKDPIQLDTAVATLRAFSLLHRGADSTLLQMSRIVQVVLKEIVTKKQQQTLAMQAVRLVHAVFPEGDFSEWKTCERYLSLAHQCAILIRTYQLRSSEAVELLERLGAYCYQQGCYIEAETYLTQTLNLQEKFFKDDVVALTQTLNSLGLLYQRQARYTEAEHLHQRAQIVREQALGFTHPLTTESLHNLAVIYEHQKQYQQAEHMYLQVLSIDKQTEETNTLEHAKTLNNLGLIYSRQDKILQAENMYQQALHIYQKLSLLDHPDRTYTLTNLGMLAEKQEDYEQAEAYYQQAATIREQTLGKHHPETAHSLNKLAVLHEIRGNYQQAEKLYREIIAIAEHTLGLEHPDTALFLQNFAYLLQKQGDYQHAEAYYHQALTIYEKTLGTEHQLVAHVLTNLSHLFTTIGKLEQAEQCKKRAKHISEQK